ncbi:pimeloyl-ACP methyl ester carboxylesterase [Paraburkholderia sp. JPY158]|uniref:Pimeloyl-ACP methyl ester carboxylesterase n=1 Tax=Paraburkholderia atlantica TaxID=2654982 RepID=A0A7W8Q9B7_PARAM|nr:alpha/beta hydrolase [Paraburkholderia atlantica]MBB5426094.1 pimeloyl-ACP methyl ester carboxylesterase [Paraburkholderia atlantica]
MLLILHAFRDGLRTANLSPEVAAVSRWKYWRAPERVRALWLVNCQPGRNPAPDVVRATSRRIGTGQHEQVIAEFAGNAIPPEDVRSRTAFAQMAHDAGSDMFARQTDAAMTRPDRWSTLETSTIPTLLIWSKADRFVPVDVGLRIAKLVPHARSESKDAGIFQHWSGHRSARDAGSSSKLSAAEVQGIEVR